MSGIEAIGIALGAFPIILQAGKDLRGVFQTLQSWWWFETHFDDFIAAVEREHISLTQNIEILVGILDIPNDQKDVLEGHVGGPLWNESHIREKLIHRIQPRYYKWFMGQLIQLKGAVQDLQANLPIERFDLITGSNLESQMWRFSFAFSRRNKKLLSEIHARNEDVFEFLERASLVSRMRPDPETHDEPSCHQARFQAFQNQARRVYECFQERWSCGCANAHPCGVTVSHHSEDEKEDRSEEPETLLIGLEFNSKVNSSSFDISVYERPAVTVQSIAAVQEQTTSATNHEDVAELSKKSAALNRIKNLGRSKGIAFLAASAMSTLGNPSKDETFVRRNTGGIFNRLKSPTNLFRPVGENTKTDIPHPKPSASEPVATAAAQQPIQTRRVHFANNKEKQLSNHNNNDNKEKAIPMTDFCSLLLHDTAAGPGLRYWDLDSNNRVLIESKPRSEATPFQRFLEQTPGRDTRIEIALITLRILLCLGSLPWVPNGWDKNNIVILQIPEGSGLNTSTSFHPFLSHDCLKTTLAAGKKGKGKAPLGPFSSTSTAAVAEAEADNAKSRLFVVGVLLLELLFQESLESQPSRTKYLGPTGEPNDYTDLCTALEWQKAVAHKVGPELAEAIRKCLSCAFDMPPDLGNPSFAQAVWRGVGEPVEGFLRKFRNPLSGMRVGGSNYGGGGRARRGGGGRG